MKIDIENLKAQMTGRELNIYQKADALIEFNKLLDYVNELEQLNIAFVSVNEEREVVCGWCKGEGWIDYDMTTEPCKACGGKQTER